METGEHPMLQAAKRKLRIDAADTADDVRVTEIVESSEAELREVLALPDEFDFSTPGVERDLLLARVYYEWNDALDDFEANYSKTLATVRERWIARTHAKSKQEDPVV